MKKRPARMRWVLAAAVALLAANAEASNNKIALIPGGPHPYFAPWEQAAADAKRDFGIAAVDFKVPSEWKLNLQTELIESLMTQGYNGFGIFPGDAVGINSTIDELAANKAPSIALAGCAQDPTKAAFCLGTDVFNSAYLGTKALIKAMGGKGRIVHLAGLLVDPNTKLRMEAVEKAVKETNGAVTLIQHLTDTDQQEAADQKINALLAPKRIRSMGWSPRRIFLQSSRRNRCTTLATSGSSLSASTTTRLSSMESRTDLWLARWLKILMAKDISRPMCSI